jgi:hypothetical protein|tara:strand:- start:75 stop:548 length:474 start_codon:yes stop_codon:yes gene_type:complete
MRDIKRNFLKKKDIQHLNKTVLGNLFEWFIQGVYDDNDVHKQFVHIFYKDKRVSSHHFDILKPTLDQLKINNLIRIKLNLLTKTPTIIEHDFHIDNESSKALTSILYLNTNNGYTRFKEEKIMSRKNTLITFPGAEFHSGTTCTDKDFRLVLNIVYD